MLIAPSPCYIDDPATGYRGGFTRDDIEELLVSIDANYVAWASTIAPMVMGNPDVPELGERLTGSFHATDPDIAQHFARCDVPVRRPRGAEPGQRAGAGPAVPRRRARPAAGGAYLHEHLAGSTLVHLAASGHCPHLSAPEETLAAIVDHLGIARERALAAG